LDTTTIGRVFTISGALKLVPKSRISKAWGAAYELPSGPSEFKVNQYLARRFAVFYRDGVVGYFNA
jgi:hypothetical protein